MMRTTSECKIQIDEALLDYAGEVAPPKDGTTLPGLHECLAEAAPPGLGFAEGAPPGLDFADSAFALQVKG